MSTPNTFEEFANLLNLLNNPNNDVRNNAEGVLDQMDPKVKLSFLLQAMSTAQLTLDIRALSAVLARRQLRNHYDKSFEEVSPTDQAHVKSQLLELMTRETIREMRLKMAEVISSLAEKQMESSKDETAGCQREWPELCQFIVVNSNSESSALRECCLRILGNVPSVFCSATINGEGDGPLSEEDKASLQAVCQLLQRGFTDPDVTVRLSACKAFYSVASTFDDSDFMMQALKTLVPHLLQTVADGLKAEEEDGSGLTVLVDLCDECADIIRPNLVPTLELCFTVLTNEGLDESHRHLALECMISLSERLPAAMRKAGHRFIDPLCQAMLKMMTDLEEEEDWSQLDEPEDDDEQSNAVTGETSLDRFACALGGKQVLDVIVRIVPQMLRSTNWRERHAGLMAISACGEGCHKNMQQVLGSIIDTVVPMLGDSHARVRYAACNALGQMSTDFSPKLQKQHHAKILPTLMRVLDDTANPRVQSHAAAALVNFCESCPKNILKSYLDQLVSKLEQVMTARFQDLVNLGKKMVLEQVVTTVAALADAVEDAFTPHYDRFVPGLKYIIQNAVQTELRLLRGKTIECISLIALAVGKERFLPDSGEIIQLLLKAQTENQDFSPDDPQMSYMISAWARICRLLGPDFQPFLPSVMGPLMKVAASEPECSLYDEDDENAPDEGTGDWTTLKLSDNQNFAINTSGIEEKATACNLLVCYAKEIKQGFAPYVEEVARLMIKLSKFYFSDEVRMASAEIFPHLLEIAASQGEGYQRQLWSEVVTTLLKVIDCEPEREVLGDFLLSMANCLKIMGRNALTLDQLNQLGLLMQTVFQTHFEKHEERISKRQDEDYDEEEEQRLLSEKDEDEYVLSKLADIMRALFITHGPEMLPFFQQLLPQITKLLEPNRPWSDFQWALCFFVDLLEHLGGEQTEMYREHIQQLFLKGTTHPEADVRQTSCYGVGIAAKSGGVAYVPFLREMLPVLIHIVEEAIKNAPGGASVINIPEELATSVENAVSAIGKIMEYRPEALISAGLSVDTLLPRWLSWLPIRYDEEEVPHVYGFVCTLLEQNHPQLMGNAMEIIPHFVYCIAVSWHLGVLKTEQPIFHRAMTLVRHVQINGEMFNQCLRKMNDEERVALEKALQVPPTSS
jgi:importin-5